MNLSIVIPAYNESPNILPTINEILSISDTNPDIDDVQVIVVDDHSSDNTFDVVSQIDNPRVQCLRLSRRSGSHTALRAGMKEATGDALLFIGADDQDNLSCVSEMVNKWRDGSKVIWALRINREAESWNIRIPAMLFYKLLKCLSDNKDGKIDLTNAQFFLIDRIVIDALNACSERHTSVIGLISWIDFKQDYVEYNHHTRKHGKSKWTLRTRFRTAKDWIVAFSGLPLKLMSIVGFIFALLGFLFAMYTIMLYFVGNPVAGWPTIMVVILLLGGIQMIMLGIIGEYLWRNLDESRKRPLYFIEKKSTGKDKL